MNSNHKTLFVRTSSVNSSSHSFTFINHKPCMTALSAQAVVFSCHSHFLSLLFPQQMGDKTLAHNAQMYHYQHQKQQMLSMGK